MNPIFCNECGVELSNEEIKDRLDTGLNIHDEDIICDECYQVLVAQKMEEEIHPDDPIGKGIKTYIYNH